MTSEPDPVYKIHLEGDGVHEKGDNKIVVKPDVQDQNTVQVQEEPLPKSGVCLVDATASKQCAAGATPIMNEVSKQEQQKVAPGTKTTRSTHHQSKASVPIRKGARRGKKRLYISSSPRAISNRVQIHLPYLRSYVGSNVAERLLPMVAAEAILIIQVYSQHEVAIRRGGA
ncbi:MAG: hypothetical protein Q9209_005832 [Squamulea sp. 1 TL-2023]